MGSWKRKGTMSGAHGGDVRNYIVDCASLEGCKDKGSGWVLRVLRVLYCFIGDFTSYAILERRWKISVPKSHGLVLCCCGQAVTVSRADATGTWN